MDGGSETALEPSFCVWASQASRSSDQWAPPELTDQQICWNGRRPQGSRRVPSGAAPFKLHTCFGKLKNFDFAELFKVIPDLLLRL